MKNLLLCMIVFSACAYSQNQQVYKIPFASNDNMVELIVANSSDVAFNDVEVKVSASPDYIKFTSTQMNISELKAKEEKEVLFTFSVDKTSPVEKETLIEFQIISRQNEKWTKQIKISVAPPEKFELFQNYPNPFNPSTTISYQIPRQGRVTLKIYNTLGEEVAIIADNIQEAGFYTMNWNASLCSSGMYICQLVAKSLDGQEYIQRKKMSLIK